MRCVSKKRHQAHNNLNRFSKFFHHWKEKKISNKYLTKIPHSLRMLPHYFGKVKV